jgi:fluoroacetyl-CoA thioesterase
MSYAAFDGVGRGHEASPHGLVSVVYVNLETGMRGDAKLVVTEADTALALGSGIVEVLGSPRLVALCEEACCNAIANALDDGITSVGMRIQFDHLQPTPIGAEVIAEAVLEKIDGRRLKFTVSASDPGGLVAAGKITRVVVDLDRFMSKCCTP